MTRIKICGITRREDVENAIELGIDALGFILAESPRKVSLSAAEDLIQGLPPFISTVGVVVNPCQTELDKISSRGIFSHIQFHGTEPSSIFKDLNMKTIKTFSIDSQEDLENIQLYREADFFLFDTRVGKSIGGTGKTFDWTLIKDAARGKPFILAGGLGPGNIDDAIRICRPDAVDLNSRLEYEPGKKDPELMRETVFRIRKTDSEIIRSEIL